MGLPVGLELGAAVGGPDGAAEGVPDGDMDGEVDGAMEGCEVGSSVAGGAPEAKARNGPGRTVYWRCRRGASGSPAAKGGTPSSRARARTTGGHIGPTSQVLPTQ